MSFCDSAVTPWWTPLSLSRRWWDLAKELPLEAARAVQEVLVGARAELVEAASARPHTARLLTLSLVFPAKVRRG